MVRGTPDIAKFAVDIFLRTKRPRRGEVKSQKSKVKSQKSKVKSTKSPSQRMKLTHFLLTLHCVPAAITNLCYISPVRDKLITSNKFP